MTDMEYLFLIVKVVCIAVFLGASLYLATWGSREEMWRETETEKAYRMTHNETGGYESGASR